MSEVLIASAEDEDAGPDPEDTVNEALAKRMEAARQRCKLQSVEEILIFLYVRTHKTFVIVGI
jgi:hypothetical protein